jgi:hypothetical protein
MASLLLLQSRPQPCPPAAQIEQAFQVKLATFAAEPVKEPDSLQRPERVPAHRQGKRRKPTAIDKTVLALPAPRRIRDREQAAPYELAQTNRG